MSDGGVYLKLYVDYLKNNLAWIRLGWGTIIFHELYMMNRMVGLCHITKYCMSVIKHCIAAGLLSWLGMLTSYQKYKADTCGCFIYELTVDLWSTVQFFNHARLYDPVFVVCLCEILSCSMRTWFVDRDEQVCAETDRITAIKLLLGAFKQMTRVRLYWAIAGIAYVHLGFL